MTSLRTILCLALAVAWAGNSATEGGEACEQVPATGTIHCYGPALLPANQSWFIALSSAGALSIERVPHAIDASPCLSDPSGWSFSGARVTMVR